jgi:hypothetical protein
MSGKGLDVEPNLHDTTDLAAAAGGSLTPPGRTAARFVYASGSRPLDGYTIKRGVGQGGFGEIYYATSDAGKEVALKLIRRNLDVELRGIRHCLNLKHPNLLTLYDIRQDNQGDTWVVMEFVADKCLEDVMAGRPDGLPPQEALAWMRGIGAGVAYLHDHGIVHRDLKPGNIFSDEGLVKVGDYGLSKFISCSRRSGHTESIGTVHYMAPEVANGRYGKEIDVYALGVMFYEMLTGRVPFDGESVGEVLMKHLTAKPDLSILPEPYRGVIGRALEKDPARRFSSVGEMLAALPPGPTVGGVTWLPESAAPPLPMKNGAAAQPPAAESPVLAQAVYDEPILRAVGRGCRKLRHNWEQANFSPLAKAILLLVLLLVLAGFEGFVVASARGLARLAVVLLVVYAVYALVRLVVLSLVAPRPASPSSAAAQARPAGTPPPGARPSPPVAPPAASPLPYGPAYIEAARAGARRGERAVPAMIIKPPRERLTELLGSLLGGALVALAMSVVMALVGGFLGRAVEMEQWAWLALVGIAGTWAVLVPAKFWEGARGEPVLRRFIMMVIGLGLGLAAYAMADFLMVHLSYDRPDLFHWQRAHHAPAGFYSASGQPLAMAHAAVFGGLLLLLRWWRQADPLRNSRFSLGAVIVSFVAAWLVTAVLNYPQPWLMMVAVTMSVSVQLSSPWVPARERLLGHP